MLFYVRLCYQNWCLVDRRRLCKTLFRRRLAVRRLWKIQNGRVLCLSSISIGDGSWKFRFLCGFSYFVEVWMIKYIMLLFGKTSRRYQPILNKDYIVARNICVVRLWRITLQDEEVQVWCSAWCFHLSSEKQWLIELHFAGKRNGKLRVLKNVKAECKSCRIWLRK